MAIKSAWMNQALFNRSFYEAYPAIKIYGLFEFVKREGGTLRDYQFANNTLEFFKAGLKSMDDVFIQSVKNSGVSDSIQLFPILLALTLMV